MNDSIELNDKQLLFQDLTYKIIGAALEVYKILGHGFLESVYEKALLKEFELRGILAKTNCPIDLNYKGDIISGHLPGILVEEKVIVDLQANEEFHNGNEQSMLNFLRATGVKVGLVINFGRDGCKPRRFVV